ncbi:MAG: divalent metal cation transporter [Acidobacteriota bacterium]
MSFLRHLGPGVLFAATAVGASHILMSPEAGARHGLGLVWLVIVAHALKYPAFACAPRWVAATGTSLIDAYAHAPGPKRWAVWMGLIDITIQGFGLIAALVGLTAAFVAAALGGPITLWALALTLVLLTLLRIGRYRLLRIVNLALLLAIALGTALAFAGALPPPSTWTLASTGAALASAVTPQLPDGSLLLVAAILGYMPTSIAVSVLQSLWSLEQRRFDPQMPLDARKARLRSGLWDLRVGYALSAGLAICFVTLGARLLAPRGLIPEGPDVALVLSQLYTPVFGAWMQPIVLTMAFCALFTTCYTMMDGFPRVFVAARRVLRGQPAVAALVPPPPIDERVRDRRTYWTFLLTATFAGMAIFAAVPDPAWLVTRIGALGLLVSPVYFALNLWAVTRRIEQPALRPGRVGVLFAGLGIVFLCFVAGLLLWTTALQGG